MPFLKAALCYISPQSRRGIPSVSLCSSDQYLNRDALGESFNFSEGEAMNPSIKDNFYKGNQLPPKE